MSAQRPVPRIGLTRAEAAEALGVGLTTFKTQIQPDLKVWRWEAAGVPGGRDRALAGRALRAGDRR